MLDTSKIYASRNHGDFKIAEYINCESVKVEFIKTGYVVITQASNIRSGKVKDRLYPSVFGVGFLGLSSCNAVGAAVNRKAYLVWQSMLGRCYDDKIQLKHPTYKGCTTCIEWHNFQVFLKWFIDNYVDGYALDKDIKCDGNKFYSPSTCLFVLPADNNIKAKAKSYRFKSPNGNYVDIYNLSEFCRENDLHCSNMVQVINGKRKQHKGWVA